MSLSRTNKSLEGSLMSLRESLKSWEKWADNRCLGGLRATLFFVRDSLDGGDLQKDVGAAFTEGGTYFEKRCEIITRSRQEKVA